MKCRICIIVEKLLLSRIVSYNKILGTILGLNIFVRKRIRIMNSIIFPIIVVAFVIKSLRNRPFYKLTFHVLYVPVLVNKTRECFIVVYAANRDYHPIFTVKYALRTLVCWCLKLITKIKQAKDKILVIITNL